MARVNLTTARIDSYNCDPGKPQSILWDSTAPGLGLRVTANGAKAFVFQAMIKGGGSPRITIGDPATWRLSEAREEARQFKLMTERGQDPREVRAAKKAADETARQVEAQTKARESLTLADVWPIYLQDRKPHWSERHYENHTNLAAKGGEAKKRGKGTTVAGPLAPLMPVLLADLTGDRIADWLAQESATRPTNAAQSFRILRALVGWTEDMPEYQGIVPAGACTARKVRKATPKSQTRDGDCLQREHLAAWFSAIRQIPNRIISSYLQGLLLTGARRNELAQLRWDDVTFGWGGELKIRDKVEGTRRIPLTPYFASLLEALPRQNEWVFSSATSKTGHIIEPRIAHTKALDAAGLPHVSLHGLRRSFGTLCEWLDIPSGVSAQIMGHKPSALAEKYYRRRPLDMLRESHVRIESWMLEQAGIEWNN